ncbi:MAG: molybdopterin-dependent oxidoreductase [Desulfobacterales bacterium]|nr:MAG: molybdopterin-dependent oxidoreductase [Desulfobacterales bacterium]
MTPYRFIGKRLPRMDAKEKVTGKALYTDDLSLPGMLCGMILRSPLPHARIVAIDVSKALKLPGVKAVLTGGDTAKIKFGIISRSAKYMDEYPLAVDRVRFIGEEVAAVAAVDAEVALEALELITVEYEELPAVFDPQEARRPGAPQLHAHAPRNISREYHIKKGDPQKAFAQCDHVREDVFATQSAIHCYMEPRAALAGWDKSGRLTVYTSTQTPYYVQQHLGLTLDINPDNIRVIKPHVGGGFGGKSDGLSAVEFCAALLAKHADRPVKIVCSRDEEFMAARRKHPIQITMKTGVKKDGTIVARKCRAVLDGGAYCSLGPLTTVLVGTFQTLPFKFEHFQYDGYRIYTNKPPCGAMRGHGGPQVHFAQDVQLDMIAEDLGLDPLEMALKNGLQTGDESAAGFKIVSSAFRECLKKAAAESEWQRKRKAQNKDPDQAYGIGLGCGGFPSGAGFYFNKTTSAHSSVIIRVGEGGGIRVYTGASDIGQGSDSVICQIVAEVLGLPLEDIHLTSADTHLTPPDMGTYSSRVTVAAGNAALEAANKVKAELFKVVSDALEANPDDLAARDRKIYVKGSPDRFLTFENAIHLYQKKNSGAPLVTKGAYNSPDPLSPTYSFGAYICEVEVSLKTGEVRVKKFTVAHDCGQPLNPMSVEGQIEGCIGMGMGYAISEQLISENGRTMNPSFLGYSIPTADQMPEIKITHVITDDPRGPFGAKETGEGSLDPAAPAIANAVYNATGVRIKDLPVTAEKILKGLKGRCGD